MEWTYYEMKLHSQSVSFSSDITELSRQHVFYCTYELQNFIPKNLENADRVCSNFANIEAAMRGTSFFEWFPKNLLVPRNPKQSKKRHDVITLLWQLWCQYNTSHNKFWSLPNTAVVIVLR